MASFARSPVVVFSSETGDSPITGVFLLITYLLLAIYCHETHGEKVSIDRVRELGIKIRNEVAMTDSDDELDHDETGGLYAKI
jgi:hypothetical protein